MSAEEVAARLKDTVRAAQNASPGHESCSDGMWDEEYGPVCSCGAILADSALDLGDPLPPSAVTADAAGSRPAKVDEPAGELTTTEGVASKVSPADPITSAVEVIDPTQPYDSKMVEEHMLDVMARLERGAHYQRVCEEDAYQRGLDYQLAHARAILEAQKQGGAADVRAAAAMVACEPEYVRKIIADMKVKAIRETMHSLRSVLSGYQSVAKSVASAYTGGGSPGRPMF